MLPSVERSILNPLSFVELSIQERLIRLEDTSAAFKLDGAAGIGDGVELGVGLGLAVGLGVGVGAGVGVGVALGVGVGAGVGVGVGVAEAAPYND